MSLSRWEVTLVTLLSSGWAAALLLFQPAVPKLPLPSLFSGSGFFLFSFFQVLLKCQLEFSVTIKMGVSQTPQSFY